MGLTEVKRALIRALQDGDYQNEARDALNEKNLLAVGDITESEVVRMLRRTTGRQYETSQHNWDRSVVVHVFKPELDGVRWYIKAYFLSWPEGPAVFISVHKRGSR